MADNEGGGGAAPWVAFLAGIIIVALVGLGIAAYTGNLQRNDTAQLELNMPDTNVNPPDIDLPQPPPAPTVPPSAEPTPEPAPTTPNTP
jgi:hypothetical protein